MKSRLQARVPQETLDRITSIQEASRARVGVEVSYSAIVREALELGLRELERRFKLVEEG